MLATAVIGRVVLAVLGEPGLKLCLECRDIGPRGPIHEKWLDFRPQEVVWARGAQFRESRRVMTAHETQNRLIVLDRRDLPRPGIATSEPSTQPGQDLEECLSAHLRRKRGVPTSTKRL